MKRILPLVALFLVTTVLSLAQRPNTALNTLASQYPREKVYIHYDKEYYVAGETIWFKGYLYCNGLPSTLSNNFYLQLINGKGEIISHKKYPVKGATIDGNIDLPDSLPQGYYHIRALTPAMMNTSHEFLYSKNLFVFNARVKTDNIALPSPSPSSFIQFFPEGGRLVGDILSVIVFRVTDSLGKPADISGVIKTDDGTMITSFKTFTPGMGKVQFKPQAGKKYIASVDMNGQTAYYPLPPVTNAGVSLKVENEKDGKMFLLTRTKKEKENFDGLWLMAEMNNMIVYESEINFESYFSVKGHLLTDSLPSGILHFTLFDNAGKPLAERLTFVNNGEFESHATIDVIKKGTGPREENIVEINFPDLAQRSLSVSVTDEEQSPAVKKENIVSKFLLDDELEEKPAYADAYLRNRGDTTQQMIFDHFLLTQPFTRFSWEKIIAGEFPEKKFTDQYLVRIPGSLKDSKTNAPVTSGHLTVFMESEDSVNQSFEIKVNEDGTFILDSLLFYGKGKFFYAYKTAQGKEKPVTISLQPLPMDIAAERLPFEWSAKDRAATHTDPLSLETIISKRTVAANSVLAKTKELDPVVVESKNAKRPLDLVNEKYSTGVFTTLGKLNLDNINQPSNDRSLSAFDYIKINVRQVEVEDNNFVNRRNFSISQAPTQAQQAEKEKKISELSNAPNVDEKALTAAYNANVKGKKFIVALFLNESPADIGVLKTIRMDQVALIKFYDPGFVGASSQGPGGAIAVYTKKEVKLDGQLEKLDHITYNGYSLTKRFYHPDYSQPNSRQGLEDTRATLYWNPGLYTDASSKTIRLKFYNSDISKKLRIIVEGFDAGGKLIHIEKTITD